MLNLFGSARADAMCGHGESQEESIELLIQAAIQDTFKKGEYSGNGLI